MADVNFVFELCNGLSDRIPAHKNLLIATSEVFRVMFNGSWKEKHDVLIVDASPTAFREFLQFFYYDEVEVTTENVGQVMNMGHKYDVAECFNACSRFFEYNMTDDNVCTAYGLAILFQQEKLMNICEINIAINTKAVFNSNSFLKCKQETLYHILRLDSMSCTETEVFNACIRWVEANSKEDTLSAELIRTYLGGAFYEIRFGSMKMDDFKAIVSAHGTLFTSDEYIDVTKAITLERHISLYFNANPRLDSWDEPLIKIDCKRELCDEGELEHNIGVPISTTFYINTTLLLRGIYCAEIFRLQNWPESLSEDLTGKLTIIETRGRSSTKEVSSVIYTEDIRLIAGGHTVIPLMQPVMIRNGIKYTIQLDLNMEFKCCSLIYFKNSELSIKCGPRFFVKFRNDVVKDGEKRGVIYGIQFSKLANQRCEIAEIFRSFLDLR